MTNPSLSCKMLSASLLIVNVPLNVMPRPAPEPKRGSINKVVNEPHYSDLYMYILALHADGWGIYIYIYFDLISIVAR